MTGIATPKAHRLARFNRYFYEYQPPQALEDIELDIRTIEQDILQMLAEVTGRATDG